MMVNILIHIAALFAACDEILSQKSPILYKGFETKDDFITLSKKYGHAAEKHQVTTKDGYILTMYHIPGNGSPIFIEHGITDSADTYIVRGQNSMAITLAEAGYDLWFGNARGNKYSRRHVKLNPDTDKEFWNFSMHEIGFYDLPAMIDFVLEVTKQSQLAAIGHSQGNAIFYVLGASRPEYNKKIKVLIALAPVCFLHHMKPPVDLAVDVAPIVNEILVTMGHEEMMRNQTAFMWLLHIFCNVGNLPAEICRDGLLIITGSDPEELEVEFIKYVLEYYPSSTSRTNVMHLAQIAKAKRFQRFNYGKEKNLQIYGTELAPEYDLNKVTMHVELLVGNNDKLSTVEDAVILKEKLPHAVYTLIKHDKMNHLDFVWGKNMDKYLFPIVSKILQKYCTKNYFE